MAVRELLTRLLRRRSAPAPPGVAPTAARESRVHGGEDWADAGLGPNLHSTDIHDRPRRESRLRLRPAFVLDPAVAHRFNAYARAAHPLEIGGLLRVVEQADGTLRAVDVRIFTHVAASRGYFELDGADVARFNLDLVARGRMDEVPQWCSLIHSHPDMRPFLSGTDRANVIRLAGPGRAFSVIAATSKDPDSNTYALHYAQGGPVPLVAQYLPVGTDFGASLAGFGELTDSDHERIAAEVAAAFVALGRPF